MAYGSSRMEKLNMENVVESELMGTSAVAKILDVTPDRVRQLVTEGKLSCLVIVGGQRLFAPKEVERLRAERKAKGA